MILEKKHRKILVLVVLSIVLCNFFSCKPKTDAELKYRQLSVESIISTEKTSYLIGDNIEMNFVVRNNDVKDKQIYLLGKNDCIFYVLSEDDQIIWASDDLQSDNSELKLFTIPAMYDREFSVSWDGKKSDGELVSAGKYYLKAEIPTSDNLKGYADSLYILIE